jgi:hypothetical protein
MRIYADLDAQHCLQSLLFSTVNLQYMSEDIPQNDPSRRFVLNDYKCRGKRFARILPKNFTQVVLKSLLEIIHLNSVKPQ